MKEKFYYIDESGNKHKYVGKITENPNGTYNGLLTKTIKSDAVKDLIYHPEIKEVKAQHSYYSYVNSAGEEILYFDNIKKDEEGNQYFTYTERNLFKLEYMSSIEGNEEYFTYIDPDTGKEEKYNGSLLKKGSSYSGFITK